MIIQICDHGKEHIFWKKKKKFTDVNAKKKKILSGKILKYIQITFLTPYQLF